MADKKRQALGRGLSALLQDPKTDITSAKDKGGDRLVGAIALIPISSIEVNPFQPRVTFKEEALQELAASIRELGIIQPITVRKMGYDKYQLISGERRFLASQIAGLHDVPCYIRIANDQEMLEMALVENIQRQELDAIEIALSYQRLIEECKLTQEVMSERVGKKRSTITNYLRLLKLSPDIQAGIRDSEISMGHARALINISEPAVQRDIFQATIDNQLSVREVEKMAKDFKSDGSTAAPKSKAAPTTIPETLLHLSHRLSEIISAKTELKRSKNGTGKLIINFNSDDDLERIIKQLKG
jgi:ParB family chromosome partitioning protein